MGKKISPIPIPNLEKHLVQPQPHLQDFGTMSINTTTTSLPGRDTQPTPSTSIIQSVPKTQVPNQTQGQSVIAHVDNSSSKQQVASSFLHAAHNQTRPVQSSKKTKASSQAHIIRPSVVKKSDNPSHKQLASLLSLAQSIPLSLTQVHALIQAHQELSKKPQASNSSIVEQIDSSASLLAQPQSLDLTEVEVSQNQELPHASTINQTISLTSSLVQPKSLQDNALIKASRLSHTRQPSTEAPQAAAMQQVESSMNKHLAPSFILASNSIQPDPASTSQRTPTVQSGGKIKHTSNQEQDTGYSVRNQTDGSLQKHPATSSIVPSHRTQPQPMCISQQVDATIARAKTVSSSELTQPVPLEVLIKHKILESKPHSLTCTILGCDFTGSLLEDGSILEVPVTGKGSPYLSGQPVAAQHLHRQPQLWLRACWGHLGHVNKNVNKKQAYRTITYMGKTLAYYCEQYSLKRVSTFLTQKNQHCAQPASTRYQQTEPEAPPSVSNEPKESSMEMSDFSQLPQESTLESAPPLLLPPSLSTTTTAASTEFNLDVLLLTGKVLLVSGRNASLELPSGFWEDEDLMRFMPQIRSQIEHDFDW